MDGGMASGRAGTGACPSRLFLALQQEFDNLWHDVTCALIELFLGEIGNGMGQCQVFIVGEAPRLGHGTAGGIEYVGDQRSGGNAMFFEHNAVEHTARAARASIADTGDDDVAVGLDGINDLLMRRHAGVVLVG